MGMLSHARLGFKGHPANLEGEQALRAALALDLLEARLHRLDALADHAAVEFDLGFAWPTAMPHPATLTLKVRPPAHQACGQVFETGQFDLKLALVTARSGAENFEDQSDAVQHFDAEVALQIALLRRRQRLVKYHRLRLVEGHQLLDFVGFARSDKQGGVRCAPLGSDAGDGGIPRRLGQQRQFVQGGIE